MNKRSILILIIVLVITAGVFVYKQTQNSDKNDSLNSTIVNKEFRYLDEISGPGLKVFKSENYHFTLAIDQDISYGYLPGEGNVFLEAEFSVPNPNSSVIPNRDTPNQFNSSDLNSFQLQIYPNDHGITLEDLDGFRLWRKDVLSYYDSDDSIQQLSVSTNEILKAVQADGVESYAVYYYLISTDYIYVFFTNDFTELEMRTFLGGFSLL
ncbi:MAG: hypothetical protein V1853_04940 [bacterium]